MRQLLLLLLQKVLLFLPELPERIELLYCLLRYLRLYQNRKRWLQPCSLHNPFLPLIPMWKTAPLPGSGAYLKNPSCKKRSAGKPSRSVLLFF